MNILERILDVISRPNYAMAEGSRRVGEATREGEPVTRVLDDFAKGFGGGITGKDKTSYSDVLREGGMENTPARGALGLGLDVALDPSLFAGTGALKAAAQPIVKGAIKRRLGGGLTDEVGKTVKGTGNRNIPFNKEGATRKALGGREPGTVDLQALIEELELLRRMPNVAERLAAPPRKHLGKSFEEVRSGIKQNLRP